MEEAEIIIEKADAKKHVGNYGDLNRQSANVLYKKYLKWMEDNKIDKEPLKFKEWIKWAKNKGIVKNYKAEGDDNVEVKKEKENLKIEITRTGKIISYLMIGIGAVMIIYSLVPKVVANPTGQSTPSQTPV